MSIDVIKSLIADFGLSVSISAIFIFIAYKFIKNTLDQNNKLMQILMDRQMNHEDIQKDKHKELIDMRLEVNNSIKNVIETFRNETDCDRVYIFEYHNGESNLNGLPFAKISATYEILKQGVLSHKARLQSIPSGLILDFNQTILKESIISVQHVEEYKLKDPVGYSVIMRPDCKSFYVTVIYNAKGYPIGFIGMDYIISESNDDQAKKAMTKLVNCATKIGTLLEIDNIALAKSIKENKSSTYRN